MVGGKAENSDRLTELFTRTISFAPSIHWTVPKGVHRISADNLQIVSRAKSSIATPGAVVTHPQSIHAGKIAIKAAILIPAECSGRPMTAICLVRNGRFGSTLDIARCDAAHYRQFDAIIDPETSRSLSAAFTFARQPDLMDDMIPAGKGRDTDLLDIEPDAV